MSRTIEQRTNFDGFPKAGELIEMTGLEDIDASQRAISNLLYQHAHDSGRIADPTTVFEIPMATLRRALSKHESGDRLRASLTALMRVIVRVAYLDGTAEQRIMISGLFRFLDISRRDLATRATLRYGIAHELQSILERSQRWGRIRAEVYCAMRSKYAMALYEMLELRRNLDRCIETFTIERFRGLMSIKPDAYRVGFDFERSVVEPAVLEVNGLSDMSVRIDLQRKHSRAPFHAATLAWWRKSPDECVMVIRERNRSKAGRMARLKGAAAIRPPGALLSLPGDLDKRLEQLTQQMPKAALTS
jgi:Initiator Replication protein